MKVHMWRTNDVIMPCCFECGVWNIMKVWEDFDGNISLELEMGVGKTFGAINGVGTCVKE